MSEHQRTYMDGESIKQLNNILKKYQCHKGEGRWESVPDKLETWQLIVISDPGLDSESRKKMI